MDCVDRAQAEVTMAPIVMVVGEEEEEETKETTGREVCLFAFLSSLNDVVPMYASEISLLKYLFVVCDPLNIIEPDSQERKCQPLVVAGIVFVVVQSVEGERGLVVVVGVTGIEVRISFCSLDTL